MIKTIKYSNDVVRVFVDGNYVGTMTEEDARSQGLCR